MTEEQKEFGEAFKDIGGFFDINTLRNENLRSGLQHLINGVNLHIEDLRLQDPRLPTIYFNFVSNLTLNACVASVGGIDSPWRIITSKLNIK